MTRPTVLQQFAIALIVMFLVIVESRAQTRTTTKSPPVIPCSGANEERLECGPLCGDKMCTTLRAFNPASIRCTKLCAPGCFCRSGYVHVDQQPAADAPVETTNAPSPVCSGQYERYDDCGNPCSERTCENLRRIDLHCSKQCVAGCYCQNGYVRKVPDGTCIPKIRCALNPL
uniref:TIL domain-containing protein n=1 Tax=Anopheles albimanus TaxID=7167 RepID=A0A182FFK4_ANOAL